MREAEGGVVLMLTSFGMVRRVFLLTGLLLADDPLWFNGGLSPLTIGCPRSLASDEGGGGWAVKEMVSEGGLSCPLLPVSSLKACSSIQERTESIQLNTRLHNSSTTQS